MSHQISDVRFEELKESAYFKLVKMHFKEEGRERSWDMLTNVHDSVSILLYHVGLAKLMFVRQFRPAVFVSRVLRETGVKSVSDVADWSHFPTEFGMTLELCAGIVDKEVSLEQIGREEVLEECGYRIPLSSPVEFVTSFASNVGLSSASNVLFYAEIDESMKVEGFGGGCGEEKIELVLMDVDQVRDVIYDPDIPRPAAFVLSVQWFLENRKNKFEKRAFDQELYS